MAFTDLLHPSVEEEANKHKLKRFVQSPNGYFMDVKCNGCLKVTTVYSHATTPVFCQDCANAITIPTGGKVQLVDGCEFRRSIRE